MIDLPPKWQETSSVYVRRIESSANEGGSGIRPPDLGPGALVNAVTVGVKASIRGGGRFGSSGPKAGAHISWLPMLWPSEGNPPQPIGIPWGAGRIASATRWVAGRMPVVSAWFGTVDCTVGDVLAAGLGIEADSMAVTWIPPRTCMPRRPARMASTMATKPSVGRTGPLADEAGVVRTAGSFLWMSERWWVSCVSYGCRLGDSSDPGISGRRRG